MDSRYDVFLSHSTSDTLWSRRFASRLRQHHGLGVFAHWTSDGIPEGVLKQGLRDSASVVVVCDASSPSSAWIRFEVGAAVALGKSMVPVVAADIAPALLPPPLRSLPPVPMTTPSETAARIVEALRPQVAAANGSAFESRVVSAPTGGRWTDELLDDMRDVGDPEADEAVRAVLAHRDSSASSTRSRATTISFLTICRRHCARISRPRRFPRPGCPRSSKGRSSLRTTVPKS
jgi:hypothetical protein